MKTPSEMSGGRVKALIIKSDPKSKLKNILSQHSQFAKTENSEVEASQGYIDDQFSNKYSEFGLLEPIYDLTFLVQMMEYNNMLSQCVDAYKANIIGFGYGQKYEVDIESKMYKKERKEIDKEWGRLKFLYDNCSYDETFTEIMKKVVQDREMTGMGYIEVLNKLNGEPGGFSHLISMNMRMTQADITPIPVTVDVLDPDGKVIPIRYLTRFRRYCQIMDYQGMPTWFKSYGDPRDVHKETGAYGTAEAPIPVDKRATGIIPFGIYSAYTPYGLPRWMGALLGMFGSRKSEELNYNYFYNGKHIPMAIVISNGSLTESSIDKLSEYATSMKGVDNAYGYLVLEAAGFEEDEAFGESSSQGVKIELKPLTEAIQTDGLFQDYDKNNRTKVRSAMRLSPLYTGESEDFTRATADTARQMAEEQIFAPERMEVAAKFNKLINHRLKVFRVGVQFKGPNLSNKEAISRAAKTYVESGTASPNSLIDLLGDLVEKPLEQLPEWGNLPLKVILELVQQDRIEFPEVKSIMKKPDAPPQAPISEEPKEDKKVDPKVETKVPAKKDPKAKLAIVKEDTPDA